ncbi:hypothetical protein [Halovenus sp. HT40]|uniref:hypothetical protein n=1 Tax=Halovenus sp. HT40 TaxID=3126691 RepID=UPI00300F1216
MKRRQILAAGAALSVGFAGCTESSPEDDESPGVSFRASLLGQTATDVDSEDESTVELETTIATELGVDPIDIAVLPSAAAVEVRRSDVSATEFSNALTTAGLPVDSEAVRSGVTAETAEQARETVRNRFERADVTGADVTVSGDDDAPALLIEVDDEHSSEVASLLDVQSRAQVLLATPNDQQDATEPETEVLLEANDFLRISEAKRADGGFSQPRVEVQLTADAAERFQHRLVESGFTSDGVTGQQACKWEDGDEPDSNQYCLCTVLDGDVVSGAGMVPEFANVLESGSFDGGYVVTASSFEQAREMSSALRTGSLPTEVDLERVEE